MLIKINLIISDIKPRNKIVLCYELNASDLEDNEGLITELIQLFSSNEDIEFSNIDAELLAVISPFADTIEQSLEFILKFISYWDEDLTFSVIDKLDEPYSNITTYNKRPKIENTALNNKFVNELKRLHFISSSKVIEDKIQINTKAKR